MDDKTLDGNALAGILAEALGTDLTRAMRTCGGCGTESPMGAHRLYAGAGRVLRCPVCADLALVAVEIGDGRHHLRFRGEWVLRT